MLEIIQRISKRLASRFKFGYYELDDMKQEAALFAWQGLEKYDGVRPLENFLWVHVRNRLYNLKRNNYSRPDKPCDHCPFDAYCENECTKYDNILDCEQYGKWDSRNQIKRNLMATKSGNDPHSIESISIEDKVLSKELYELIDSNMPLLMREDWIRFINKLKISKNKRIALQVIIINILEENGIEHE
ncbi:MAG: hypothetical protein GY751_18155 [Bacteroidetes bacterium]|nr:hypothetical protein [Bacteroidota bacterium]